MTASRPAVTGTRSSYQVGALWQRPLPLAFTGPPQGLAGASLLTILSLHPNGMPLIGNLLDIPLSPRATEPSRIEAEQSSRDGQADAQQRVLEECEHRRVVRWSSRRFRSSEGHDSWLSPLLGTFGNMPS